MPTPDKVIVETIAALVQDVLSKSESPRPVTPSDSLSDAGVSSLSMVNLMFAIEATFDIFIPADRVTATSFRSIETIAAMVEQIRAETLTAAT